MSIHPGISCDFCRKKNFSTRRYKCLICNDFDLCANCYENSSNQKHSIDHPMQLILTSNDYEDIYYRKKRTSHSPMSLVCSLCNQNGFSLEFLIKHIDEKHRSMTSSVLCPICFIRQNHLSKHLRQHTTEHLNIKTKKSLNITEKEESKVVIKPPESVLLGKFLRDYPKKNENYQRNSFIHGLLTDLFNQDIYINHH